MNAVNKYIDVAVGIISPDMTAQSTGRIAGAVAGVLRPVLLAWRDASKHQGGCYEFPGGKVDAGETPKQALVRELQEEIGITPTQVKKLTCLCYDYPEKTVRLHVFLVLNFLGEPTGVEGQKIKWVSAFDLPSYEFPAANKPLVRMAQLQASYIITENVAALSRVGFDGETGWLAYYSEKLPQHAQCYVREKNISDLEYIRLLERLVANRPDLKLFIQTQVLNSSGCQNGLAAIEHTLLDKPFGWHMTHAELMQTEQLKRDRVERMIIAACHDSESINKANELGVDAITISPVKPTVTHPHAAVLGWDRFDELAKQSNCPVYALGGMMLEDLAQLHHTDVLGLAGISGLLG